MIHGRTRFTNGLFFKTPVALWKYEASLKNLDLLNLTDMCNIWQILRVCRYVTHYSLGRYFRYVNVNINAQHFFGNQWNSWGVN